MLNTSVHTDRVLADCNRLLGEPLRPGQANCLFCHDEPTFRRGGETWAQQQAPISRCDVCHDPKIVGETRYYWYWHVYARSHPAHTHRGLVRLCAVCHADPKVRRAYELPDSVSSYLYSFHGRATLLGSEATAACLNCHVGRKQNVHVMQAPLQAGSPANHAELAYTCRSPSCHATAGQRVTSAAVHLDLSTSRGVDFFIACLFVLLIVSTFGPSAMLTAMDMFMLVLGRHDPAHAQRRELARDLLNRPQTRKLLTRFTPHQRVQHWGLMACFVTLAVTGFPIKFAQQPWASWFIDRIGGLSRARFIHHHVGLLLLAGMAYHLCYIGWHLLKERRRSGKGLIRSFLQLPMVMRPADLKEMLHLLGYLFFLRRSRPETGRFSMEEKFEYFGVFWGVALLGVTGLLMWANAWTSRYIPGRFLTIASLVHSFEAFLALLHVGVLHMITVIFSPSVFPISPAMFTGMTPPEELAESHSLMLSAAAQQVGADSQKGADNA
jgi:cytochrome b subunit of formate dehydrogenase